MARTLRGLLDEASARGQAPAILAVQETGAEIWTYARAGGLRPQPAGYQGPASFHEYLVTGSLVGRVVWNTVASAIIIPLGKLATGRAELFRYLKESVNEFDGRDAFELRLSAAGFRDVRSEPMNGWQRGIVHTVLASH